LAKTAIDKREKLCGMIWSKEMQLKYKDLRIAEIELSLRDA
jgi:hypothetical protein